jgi:hypothetical protein
MNLKLSGILFVMAAFSFFVAAVFSKQPAFYALGAVFIVLGVVFLGKAQKK